MIYFDELEKRVNEKLSARKPWDYNPDVNLYYDMLTVVPKLIAYIRELERRLTEASRAS